MPLFCKDFILRAKLTNTSSSYNIEKDIGNSKTSVFVCECQYQRTNGPVNAHLISWPSKAQNIKNRKIYCKEMN